MKIKRSRLKWLPCWRIIPSIYPPVQLFERVTAPNDLEAIFQLESMTNDRLRDEIGNLHLVPKEQRISGPGSSYIMAAFTHLNPNGSRFSDGSFGVYYTAKDFTTAVSETKYHREQFLSWTNEAPGEIDMRVLKANLSAELHDIRNRKNDFQKEYSKNDYVSSQALSHKLRKEGCEGIAYNSVRCTKNGECAAVFQPNALSNCRVDTHLCYVWDGSQITTIYEKKALDIMCQTN